MSVMDVLRPRPKDNPEELPPSVKARMMRGRAAMLRDSSRRRLCQKFLNSQTYAYLTDKGQLTFQSTAQYAVPGQGKPPHRIRNTYNFIKPIVMGKVSAASQRIPSYEILPSTTEPEDIGAARLGEKVALYGYDKWHLRRVTVKTMTLAIGGGGEGFALPYFDSNVGPFLVPEPDPVTGMPSGEPIGQGEIRVKVFDGNQVYWEPGVDFLDSQWWATESAEPIDEVQLIPGFFGEPLKADATTHDVPNDRDADNSLVMVGRYYERPCPKYPDGRTITVANGRVIVDYRLINSESLDSWEPYPVVGADGQVLDEPLLHRLAWDVDVERDRPLGLTWELIDPQRTIQDCWNKLLELKNRALNLRMLAPRGSNLSPMIDEGGTVVEFDIQHNGTVTPKWEDVSNAIAVASPLMSMLEAMKADMRELGFDTQISADANVAAKTVNAVIETNAAKWQTFLGDAADWHSRLMRHCLLLVGRHYSEAMMLAIRGRFGPETIQDFTGAQLMGQADVRVLPGSLEWLTRDQITQRVFAYADRGWITPQQAMVAISSGTADVLIQSLELDIARVDRIIQKINDGTIMDMPTRLETIESQQPVTDPATGEEIIDPATGEPQTETVSVQEEVPVWMPMDMVDDLGVWRARIGDFLKTDTFGNLPAPMQEVAKQIRASIDDLQRRKAMRDMEQQTANAQSLGLGNAAKPQRAKPLPDLPAGNPSADRPDTSA